MGWQEFMIIAILAVPFYLMWKIISGRGASYWWFLLILLGWVLGPLLVTSLFRSRRHRTPLIERTEGARAGGT